jgi:membrane protease YdiL (CAAX protease family)
LKGCDDIFNNLADFDYQRSIKEAIGFYIAYFFLAIILAVFLALVLSATMQNNIYDFGLIGNTVAIIVSPGVSFLILKEKKLLGNFGFILLALLSGLLAIFLGVLGGLIPAAYLTTKPANAK